MSVVVHIENIFSIPIYTSIVDVSDLVYDDIHCLKNKKINDFDIISASENEKLLQSESRFKQIKKIIDEHTFHFYENILGYESKDVYPEMVASWLVKSEPGNETSWHSHSNSNISGVLYLKTHENCGNICFRIENEIIQCLSPPVKNINSYNNRSHTIRVKDGLLLLFPSWLSHKVQKNKSENVRYSIAFNYFFKGVFHNRTGNLE